MAGGTLHPGVIDVGARPPERPPITLRLGQIERILGITIDRANVVRILSRWGWSRSPRTSARSRFGRRPGASDLEREIDLIEEVARIHGYDHIPGGSGRSPRPAPPAARASGSSRRFATARPAPASTKP